MKRIGIKWMGLLMMIVMLGTLVGCRASYNEEVPLEKVIEQGFEASITDSTGTVITLDKEPERIVSLAPSTTEILYFLGVEDKIVGRTDYCSFPETVLEVPSIGGTSNPNIEAIVALEPDLVVASTLVSDEVINKLREVGIKIAFLNEQEGFEGTYLAIQNISILVGKEEEAEKIIIDMKQQVEDIKAKVQALVESKEKTKVYYTIGFGENDYTAGGDTFIGEIITLAGGENIAQDIEGWAISKEEIAEKDPDIIIMPSGRNMREDIGKAEFYKELRAVKQGKLYEINEDIISRQGPRIVEAFEEMAKIIHPEIE